MTGLSPRRRWDRTAVSPVLATILLVAITIVLVAIVFVMVAGFSGRQLSTPQGIITQVQQIEGGRKFLLSSLTSETIWSDVKFLVELNGTLVSAVPSFENYTAAKTPGSSLNVFIGDPTLGGDRLIFRISDTAADGRLNLGDWFSITAADGAMAPGSYAVYLVYLPSGEEILEHGFPIA